MLAVRRRLRAPHNEPDVVSQIVQRHVVGIRPCAYRHVARSERAQCGKHFDAYELAKPSLHAIAANSAVLVPRNHDRDPRMTERGSEDPDIEVRGPNPLPLSNDTLNVGASRQSLPARKAEAAPAVRRLRICLAVLR